MIIHVRKKIMISKFLLFEIGGVIRLPSHRRGGVGGGVNQQAYNLCTNMLQHPTPSPSPSRGGELVTTPIMVRLTLSKLNNLITLSGKSLG